VVVIDIGAEFHGYTADVTRTIPIGGRYSPEQRAIYEIVYAAQEAGIQATQAGSAFYAPHQAAQQVLAEGLARLGLIASPNDQAGLRRFFMHGTSHYLGLDVHDVGSGGPMQPGTVITVEPGLYIAAAEDIDPKWWNIGVRIEDDVLVTANGPVLLSGAAPRRIDEIEALMGSRPVS
jgi:Xaa-Pro aminopeptidase